MVVQTVVMKADATVFLRAVLLVAPKEEQKAVW